MNPKGTDVLQTRLRERDKAENELLLQTVITTIAKKTTKVETKAAATREIKMITLTMLIETNQ